MLAALKARCSVALSAALMDENLVDMTVTSRAVSMVDRLGTSTVARMVRCLAALLVDSLDALLVGRRVAWLEYMLAVEKDV